MFAAWNGVEGRVYLQVTLSKKFVGECAMEVPLYILLWSGKDFSSIPQSKVTRNHGSHSS
jgi:hypothetical protein